MYSTNKNIEISEVRIIKGQLVGGGLSKKKTKKRFVKIDHDDYKLIIDRIDKVRATLDSDDKRWHDLLYVTNSMFEATHNFDTGKPYLHS